MADIKPDQVVSQFFKAFMQTQCHICWGMLSKKTQAVFLEKALQGVYERNPDAAKAAKLGKAEIKLLFENNDTTLLKTFWKTFFNTSHAEHFFRFGYYKTIEEAGNKATVEVTFKYPDGRSAQVNLTMLKEMGMWKLAYVESGLPV